MIAQAHFTIADLSDATAEVIVGTQAAATNAWTGNATFSELRDGQTILYWLPFAGTSSSATLDLTLANGRNARGSIGPSCRSSTTAILAMHSLPKR